MNVYLTDAEQKQFMDVHAKLFERGLKTLRSEWDSLDESEREKEWHDFKIEVRKAARQQMLERLQRSVSENENNKSKFRMLP